MLMLMLMLNKYSRQTDTPFNSAERAAKPNGRSKVLPDVTSVVTDVMKKKRARLYRDSCFVDAKYGSSKLYAVSYGYEPVGHADVLSKSPAANAGVLPLMIYVATADTPSIRIASMNTPNAKSWSPNPIWRRTRKQVNSISLLPSS